MQKERTLILAINGGSSSIKFAFYQANEALERGTHGSISRLGQPDATLTVHDSTTGQQSHHGLHASDPLSSADFLIRWIDQHIGLDSIRAVGHRVVHGMHHTEPERITPELMRELRRITPYSPEHLPLEIEIIDAFGKAVPAVNQVACFDTAFHRNMPRVARLLPIPRRFDALGIERYGFHGLSYAYLMEELTRVAGEKTARGRVILAHLGNGASMAAIRDGQSIDTSMGFTPAGGLTMGTRPGDMDPGIAWYLMSAAHLSLKQLHHLIHHESGLIGVSGTSSDMRDLIKTQASDVRAAEAVELFCYQTRKWIGAFAAALGGLDTLVFAGGIGENAPEVRLRILRGLEFLGVACDAAQNRENSPVISSGASRVSIHVIRTDEEKMIARHVYRLMQREVI